MGARIDSTVGASCVYLRWTGKYSLEEAKKFIRESVDAAMEYHQSRIIMDLFSVTGHLPGTEERYAMGAFLADYIEAHAPGKISEIVVAGHAHFFDPFRLGGNVAGSRGVTVLGVTSLEEAIELLALHFLANVGSCT